MRTFRFANATQEEAAVLADLVQRAYRGDVGWTTEAAILAGKRVDAETVLQQNVGKTECGMGRTILAEAEKRAKEVWDVACIEMTVIAQRGKLIEWYERRGYTKTGETQPFPVDADVGTSLRDDLHFVVLVKKL
ncbi:GNAT family N-acetyltransferase [Mycena venus]|uniref:GNAT family N-acetyltransferase n=1 Tax=Mycena venus TaxID=2733690 RepID=A0A8H6Y2M7_9AGAR|nr:GNAT family N-acetyltransferase [Mycena venus]